MQQLMTVHVIIVTQNYFSHQNANGITGSNMVNIWRWFNPRSESLHRCSNKFRAYFGSASLAQNDLMWSAGFICLG